jgi:ABC-type Fe3+/spermidine/putrescine transport system ATPase subunit
VTKRFGRNVPAVDDISLDVPRGSFTTLLGPSGCGKTTTLRMIAGFYEPDEGDIFLGTRRINDVPAHRRKTAMVFQDYALFPHMSVEENVAYGLRLAGVSREAIHKRVRDTLAFLGLARLESRAPHQLSGGQQQRVALARALVMNPEVLLLDEPLSNLDARLRVNIRGELIAIQRQLGITTIYVTHDQEEALAMSDWVAVMNHGKVVQWGTPWDVYYQPRTAFMAEFVGSVNLVRSRVISSGDGVVRVQLGKHGIDLPFRNETPQPIQSEVLLCIRPETLALASTGAEHPYGFIALPGEVVRRTFLGHLLRYTVRVDPSGGQAEGQEWLVDQPDPGGTCILDGPVTVLVNPRRIHAIPE